MPLCDRANRPTDGVRQFLGVVGVVDEDRRTIGERDDRNVVAGRHSRHEVRQPVRRNVMSSRAAALLSTRIATSIGSVARDTQNFALDAVFFDLKRIGEGWHRFAVAIDRAHEHHAFASWAACAARGADERTAIAANMAAAATNDRINVTRM